jgi:putative CocE/NonD family hydrolase
MGVMPRWGVQIPMRDGAELNASVYQPPGEVAPGPTLFALTPYTVQRNHHRASFFASAGYRFVVADVRGRGDSDGEFRPFVPDAEDAADVIEWIAAQPFSDGRVGMFSGSYEGWAQWAAAKEFPPHLVSIAPSASAAPGIEFPRGSSPFSSYLVHWLGYVTGRTAPDNIYLDQQMWRDGFRRWFESGRPFRELDAVLGNPSPIFQEWLDHEVDDDYWRAMRPTAEQIAAIHLPILSITGTYDSQQFGALYYYREHLARATPEAAERHFLLIGPWDHFGILAPRPEASGVPVGEAGRIDTLDLLRQWYDWTLRGDGPRPSLLADRFTYYVMGEDAWRSAPSLEAATTRTQIRYLASERNAVHLDDAGTLGDAPSGEPDCYVHDPRDTSLAALESTVDTWSAVDDRLVHAADGRRLVYHGEPFERDVVITGFPSLTAWIGIDQPDTDLRAALYEIALDGSSVLLGADVIRARYRDGTGVARPLESDEPLPYEFSRFPFIARRIPRGHRLRLVVGPVHSIGSEKNHGTGGAVADESIDDARPITVRLVHDADHPSALAIPFGDD